jgi:hypothetical protein
MGKQQASDWKIAGSYWFLSAVVAAVSGVAISLAMSIVARSGIVANTALFKEMINLIIGLLGIWAGAMYAGNSVNKKYIIKNKESVTLKALIWNIVAGAIIIILFILLPGASWKISFIGVSLPMAILFGFLWISFVALFYIFTAMKYIKNSQ